MFLALPVFRDIAWNLSSTSEDTDFYIFGLNRFRQFFGFFYLYLLQNN